MVPVSLLSSAPHARRRRTPQQLSDTRLDALAKAWTAQDRARLKAHHHLPCLSESDLAEDSRRIRAVSDDAGARQRIRLTMRVSHANPTL